MSTYTGEDFVKGIIGYLREKKRKGVCFEQSTYDDESMKYIPRFHFGSGRMMLVDTVWLPDAEMDAEGQIGVTVDDDSVHPGLFTGQENEDFETLFFETYYYINDAEDPEAEEWLDAFLAL